MPKKTSPKQIQNDRPKEKAQKLKMNLKIPSQLAAFPWNQVYFSLNSFDILKKYGKDF